MALNLIALDINFGRRNAKLETLGPQTVWIVLLHGGIGDIVMVLDAMKMIDSARVEYLIPAKYKFIQTVMPSCRFREYDLSPTGIFACRKSLERRAGVGLLFSGTWEVYLVQRLLGIKTFYGYINRLDNFYLDGQVLENAVSNISNRHKLFVSSLVQKCQGLQACKKDNNLTLAQRSATEHSGTAEISFDEPRYVLLSLCKTSNWPMGVLLKEHIYELIEGVLQRLGCRATLVGGLDEVGQIPVVDELNAAYPGRIDNFVGRTSFDGLCDLIKNATVVVSNDNGISHLARFFDKPNVTVYTFSDSSEYTWGERSIGLQNRQYDCMPCVFSDLRYPKDHTVPRCRYFNRCVETVDVKVILDAVKNLAVGAGR